MAPERDGGRGRRGKPVGAASRGRGEAGAQVDSTAGRSGTVGQLVLAEVLTQLDQNQGKPQNLLVSPEDVGGELLALLSKGLYTNPLDSIREYVQNAVDAKAHKVVISIRGHSLQIFDDGAGMGLREILEARQFGLSGKSVSQHVGFRGIGIYSGFDLCERLLITSLQKGADHSYVLEFDFGAMRKQLDRDRKKGPGERKTALTELLSKHTFVSTERSTFPKEKHFTSVELLDISDTHLRQLSNRREMRRYLLQSLPIDFSDSFPYAKPIRAFLAKHVPGYNAVSVKLQAEGQPDEIVATYADEDLHTPEDTLALQGVEFDVIRNSSKAPVAVVWSCLNTERGRIQPRPRKKSLYAKYFDDRPEYEGFIYKVKGFAIGDRRKLLPTFKRKPQLYPWFTGEVYVVDPEVLPNAERHDFETNHPRRSLDLLVQEKMGELEEKAEDFQARDMAEERLREYTTQVAALGKALNRKERQDDNEAFSTLRDIDKDLRRQKTNLEGSSRTQAEELLKRIKTLQTQIKQQSERENAETERRAAAEKHGETAPDNNGTTAGETEDVDDGSTTGTPETPPSLLGVLEEAGWDLDNEIGVFAEIVQDSLESVLGQTSTNYQLIVKAIASRLENGADLDADS